MKDAVLILLIDHLLLTHLSGFNLPRRLWCTLNRFRMDHRRCAANCIRWQQTSDPTCCCGAPQQMMMHIIEDCPVTRFPGRSISIYLSVCLSVRPSVRPSIRPSVHGSDRSDRSYSSIDPIHPSICPSVRPSIHPLIHPSIYPCLSKKPRLRRRKCRSTTRAPNNVKIKRPG